MTATESTAPADRGQRPLWRRLLPPFLSLVLLGAVFFWFLPQFTSIADVWTSVKSMSWVEVTILLLAAIWNLATYQFVGAQHDAGDDLRAGHGLDGDDHRGVQHGARRGRDLPRAHLRDELLVGLLPVADVGLLLVSGLFNNFAKLGLPVLAWPCCSRSRPAPARVTAGLAGWPACVAVVVLLAAAAQPGERRPAGPGRARGVGVMRPFGRPPVQGWDQATTKFRDRTALLLHARWYWITLAHAGQPPVAVPRAPAGPALRRGRQRRGQLVEALAVFAFARLLTAIPFTPGGLGVVELALITGLSAAGGRPREVAAAVLIFRALTYVLPIPLGLVTYIFWQRNKSWRRAPNSAPRTDWSPRRSEAAPPRVRYAARGAPVAAVPEPMGRGPAVRAGPNGVLQRCPETSPPAGGRVRPAQPRTVERLWSSARVAAVLVAVARGRDDRPDAGAEAADRRPRRRPAGLRAAAGRSSSGPAGRRRTRRRRHRRHATRRRAPRRPGSASGGQRGTGRPAGGCTGTTGSPREAHSAAPL
jgi:hypothetical protein